MYVMTILTTLPLETGMDDKIDFEERLIKDSLDVPMERAMSSLTL